MSARVVKLLKATVVAAMIAAIPLIAFSAPLPGAVHAAPTSLSR